MGKEKRRSKKRFIPLIVIAIILSLTVRIGLIGGLGYVAMEELSYKSSHSSSRSSKKDKDKDKEDEDDEDQDDDDEEEETPFSYNIL